jgi:hypothetical protein
MARDQRLRRIEELDDLRAACGYRAYSPWQRLCSRYCMDNRSERVFEGGAAVSRECAGECIRQ